MLLPGEEHSLRSYAELPPDQQRFHSVSGRARARLIPISASLPTSTLLALCAFLPSSITKAPGILPGRVVLGEQKMEATRSFLLPLFVWLVFLCMLAFFTLMYRWARKRKGPAMAFGMLVQMFLPDPQVQQTIEFVVESKQQKRKKTSLSHSDKQR